jgi:hypothetical protein
MFGETPAVLNRAKNLGITVLGGILGRSQYGRVIWPTPEKVRYR